VNPSIVSRLSSRFWPNGFIAAFIAIQLLLPLHYYTVRMDGNDERWAWRMFSPTRMVTCEVTMTVDGQPLPLSREFHQAWTEVAQRGRRVVVETMGAHLCRKHPDKAVVARLACKPITSRHSVGPVPDGMSRASWLRGREYFMGGFDLCEIPEL
jgi:hypothetical protein